MNRTRETKADGVIIIEKQKTGDRKMKMANKCMMTAVVTAMMFTAGGVSAGNLTPPGAPDSTMKTLDEIHSAVVYVENKVVDSSAKIDLLKERINLATVSGTTTAHYYITQSGSYYLSENLEVSKTYGILVDADDVTIDLNGFLIARDTTGTKYGIYLNGGTSRSTILNGNIQGLTKGISCGLSPFVPNGSFFERIVVSGCSNLGIDAGEFAQLVNCQATKNEGTYAIKTRYGSVLKDCSIFENLVTSANVYVGDGAVLNNCNVYGNGTCTSGISTGKGAAITRCVVSNNETKHGILSGDDAVISHCVVRNNSCTEDESFGIKAGYRTTIIGCTVASQTSLLSPGDYLLGTGVYMLSGGIIRDCTVSANAGDGIRVYGDCLVINNNCQNNGKEGDGAGIHSVFYDNRIDGNTCTDNDRGIDVDNAGNFIVKNSCSGNGNNYDINGTQTIGPIITATGTITSENPWANFSF